MIVESPDEVVPAAEISISSAPPKAKSVLIGATPAKARKEEMEETIEVDLASKFG